MSSRLDGKAGGQKRRALSSAFSRESSPSSESDASPRKKPKLATKPSLTIKGFQRHYTVHDYHDYARTTPGQLLDHEITIKPSRGGVHNPFPVVLHSMISESDEKGSLSIISWQPHGRAFLIHKPKAFVENVLPEYFKHSKLSSFQRQLSLYGFVRLNHDGPDKGAYYHELFLRGRDFLCNQIQRTRVKGTWVRTTSSPESEPDFCSMNSVIDIDDDDQRKFSAFSRTCSCEGDQEGPSFVASYAPVVSEADDQSSSTSRSSDEHSCLEDSTRFSPVMVKPIIYSMPVASIDVMEILNTTSEFQNTMKCAPGLAHGALPIFGGLRSPPTLPSSVVGQHYVVRGEERVPGCCVARPGDTTSLNHKLLYWEAKTQLVDSSRMVEPRLDSFEDPSLTKHFPTRGQSPSKIRRLLDNEDLDSFLLDVDLGMNLDLTEESFQQAFQF